MRAEISRHGNFGLCARARRWPVVRIKRYAPDRDLRLTGTRGRTCYARSPSGGGARLSSVRGNSMRIAVVGAGGVGGGFGAALAKAGADVVFIARGAHLAAMRSEGLKVQGGRGETHLVPTRATDNPAEIGKVDIVLFCVKLWDVESAGQHIRPLRSRHRGDPAAERHRCSRA